MGNSIDNRSTISDLAILFKESGVFIWREFEFFVRRAILPSSVFFMMIFVVDSMSNNLCLYKSMSLLLKGASSLQILFIILIIILSTNYILKFLGQILFDNFIKVKFDSILPFCKKEQEDFLALRKKVIDKLSIEYDKIFDDFKDNDQILYQIMGNILPNIATQRYVSDAKEAGIIVISAMLSLLWYGWLNDCLIIAIVISFIIYLIGFFFIKAKYRSRAYRLYINYLLMENKER